MHPGDLDPGPGHVLEFGLLESPDCAIWEFAKARDFVIVSADSDFYELARREAIRVAEFVADPDLSVLVLDRD